MTASSVIVVEVHLCFVLLCQVVWQVNGEVLGNMQFAWEVIQWLDVGEGIPTTCLLIAVDGDAWHVEGFALHIHIV